MLSGPSVSMMTPSRLALLILLLPSTSHSCTLHVLRPLLSSTKFCLTFHFVLVLGSLYMHKPVSVSRSPFPHFPSLSCAASALAVRANNSEKQLKHFPRKFFGSSAFLCCNAICMMLLSNIAIFALHWHFSETFIRGSCEDKKKKKKSFTGFQIFMATISSWQRLPRTSIIHNRQLS